MVLFNMVWERVISCPSRRCCCHCVGSKLCFLYHPYLIKPKDSILFAFFLDDMPKESQYISLELVFPNILFYALQWVFQLPTALKLHHALSILFQICTNQSVGPKIVPLPVNFDFPMSPCIALQSSLISARQHSRLGKHPQISAISNESSMSSAFCWSQSPMMRESRLATLGFMQFSGISARKPWTRLVKRILLAFWEGFLNPLLFLHVDPSKSLSRCLYEFSHAKLAALSWNQTSNKISFERVLHEVAWPWKQWVLESGLPRNKFFSGFGGVYHGLHTERCLESMCCWTH